MATAPFITKAQPTELRKVTIVVMPHELTTPAQRNRIIEIESVEKLWEVATPLMMTLTELNLAFRFEDAETGPTLYVTLPFSNDEQTADMYMWHTADLLTTLTK